MTDLDAELELPPTLGTGADAARAAVVAACPTGRTDPTRAVAPGPLSLDDCQSAIAEGHGLWRADRRAIREACLAAEQARPSLLLQAARDLGMHPQPIASGVGKWQVGCPGRRHYLMLSPRSERFGCGYCNVRCGPQELTDFITARQLEAGHR
jgi:hypothetical protein